MRKRLGGRTGEVRKTEIKNQWADYDTDLENWEMLRCQSKKFRRCRHHNGRSDHNVVKMECNTDVQHTEILLLVYSLERTCHDYITHHVYTVNDNNKFS